MLIGCIKLLVVSSVPCQILPLIHLQKPVFQSLGILELWIRDCRTRITTYRYSTFQRFHDAQSHQRVSAATQRSPHRAASLPRPLSAAPSVLDWSASILKWLPRTHHVGVPILSIVSSRPHTTTSSLNLESKYFPETLMKSCLQPSLQSKALCSNDVA